MAQRPDSGKERQWLDRIVRWRRSRLTVRAFCEQQGFSEPSFYAWRRVLRERGLIREDFRLDMGSGERSTPTVGFVEVAVEGEAASDATAIEIVLSERRTVRVRPGFDADTLLKLVRLLEEPPC